MLSSKIVQLSLAILMLLVNSSLLMPIQSTLPSISTSSGSENPTTIQSTAEATTESPNSAAAPQEVVANGCTCRRINANTCTSLQDAIFTVIEKLRERDTPYHFFTLKDLFYSAILDDRQVGRLQGFPLDGSSNINSQRERDGEEARCRDLMARYNLPTKDTDQCTWSYRCTQNQLQFPSFHIEAVLDRNSTGVCNPVKTLQSRRFLKTVCQQDTSKLDWLDCTCQRTVIGFRRSLE